MDMMGSLKALEVFVESQLLPDLQFNRRVQTKLQSEIKEYEILVEDLDAMELTPTCRSPIYVDIGCGLSVMLDTATLNSRVSVDIGAGGIYVEMDLVEALVYCRDRIRWLAHRLVVLQSTESVILYHLHMARLHLEELQHSLINPV